MGDKTEPPVNASDPIRLKEFFLYHDPTHLLGVVLRVQPYPKGGINVHPLLKRKWAVVGPFCLYLQLVFFLTPLETAESVVVRNTQ